MVVHVRLKDGEIIQVSILMTDSDDLEDCDIIDNWLCVHVHDNNGWYI